MTELEQEFAELNEFVVQKVLSEIDTHQREVQRCRNENLATEEQNAVFKVRQNFEALYKILVPIVKVKVGFSENSMFRNREFASLREMTHHFNRYKTTEPGYDKTSVEIHFADSFVYTRRYDIGMDDTYSNIHKDLLDTVKFYAGLKKPSRMTDEQYAQCVNEDSKKEYLAIYYKYALMDNPMRK